MLAKKWIFLCVCFIAVISFLLISYKKELLEFISLIKSTSNEIAITRKENDILKRNALVFQALVKTELNNAEYQNIVLNEALAFKKRFEEETDFILQYASCSTVSHDGIIATSLNIDLGANDGIKKDMAVITQSGLIGLISDVQEHSSVVALITNLGNEQTSKAISVKLKENDQTTGIITEFINEKLDTGNEEQYFVMKKIEENSKIEAGNTVITSGLGGVFPEGIRVGTIDSISNSSTLTREARIKLEFNPSQISYVFIVERRS